MTEIFNIWLYGFGYFCKKIRYVTFNRKHKKISTG